MHELLEKIKKELGDTVLDVKEFTSSRVVFEIPLEKLRETVKLVFEKYGFRIAMISTLDQGFYFELLYHLVRKNTILSLKIIVPKESPKVPSVTDIIPGANWVEREVRDLFGIEFENHPEPLRVVLPPDWKAEPPLKKPIGPKLPPTYAEYFMNLVAKAALATTTGIVKRRRKQLGLPETVSPVLELEEVINDIKKISKELKIERKVSIRR